MTSQVEHSPKFDSKPCLPAGLQASETLLGGAACATLPVIDFGPWLEGTPAGKATVAAQLREACETFGFFFLANHGVPDEIVEAASDAQKEFFALPAEAKRSVSWRSYIGEVHPPSSRGYVELQGEALDPTAKPDIKEFLDLGMDAEPTRPFAGKNRWPEGPAAEQVQEATTQYMECAKRCAHELIKALAASLGLEENFFDKSFDDPVIIHRLLHYPASGSDSFQDELKISCGKHTDYGMITLLYQFEYGLQIRHFSTGDWMWVPPPPVKHAFTVNLGDCMQFFTNGKYQSTLHRVVNCSGRERFSMAFFVDPNFDCIVAPIPECLAADARPRFEPLEAGQMKLAKYSAVWQKEDDIKIEYDLREVAVAESLFKS